MKKLFLILLIQFSSYMLILCQNIITAEGSKHDLHFKSLAKTWDEGIPLGNGMLGALIWENNGKLRLSLDRADLWDLRPMKNLSRKEFKFNWVIQQYKKLDYAIVQDLFDKPYEEEAAPTKIPAGAMEFNISSLGELEFVNLSIKHAICEVRWKNGAKFFAFVNSVKPVGWFRFENIKKEFDPAFLAPKYFSNEKSESSNSVVGQDLTRLSYKQGKIYETKNRITYRQEGWNGYYYTITINWKKGKDFVEGAWSISSHYPENGVVEESDKPVQRSIIDGYNKHLNDHKKWWKEYWEQSSLSVPDPILEKQWYLETYKFGSAARKGSPPISLQAVWTADNGKIPPWKGDFHHDLNTQLSYWPCYSANHLDEGTSYLDWLWKNRSAAKKYTKEYFGTRGLNVPGVSTLTGEPMAGWIQYSLSPTVSIWLAQHFYLHWRYSMDRKFLKNNAYPWIKDCILHINELTIKDENNKRSLPLSSSPEIGDNSIKAWHSKTTNYDLALIRWLYKTGTELANELKLKKESEEWNKILNEWPDLAVSELNGALCVAPGINLQESHRHFSHLMAIHPLGIINWEKSPKDQNIIKSSLDELEKLGPSLWCGYSYSWLGNMKARAMDGFGAAKALKIFAECFCLPNSFHANGDQSGTGKSTFTYRPFTLEGNFAFASGLQEMLLQSYSGLIKIFPAVPNDWKDISFNNLRAEGAFLISARKQDGQLRMVTIKSEKGGVIKLNNSFGSNNIQIKGSMKYDINTIITIETKPNDVIRITVL